MLGQSSKTLALICVIKCFKQNVAQTMLCMLYKGKGIKEELSCNRCIHCKSWLPRLAEAWLDDGGIKKHMVKKSSRFQVGGPAGHWLEELLFCMKSVISKYEYSIGGAKLNNARIQVWT